MEFKGTKGKWYIDIDASGYNEFGTAYTGISAGDSISLADVYGDEEEDLANAKLIACAPELLEMVIRFNNINSAAREHISEELFEQAKELIKKATDESK